MVKYLADNKDFQETLRVSQVPCMHLMLMNLTLIDDLRDV
uniref:Uncharacterized protein n=1 Tax=Arundo donax TaxID=35708 RepID=A0A0A9EN87_ARUDO